MGFQFNKLTTFYINKKNLNLNVILSSMTCLFFFSSNSQSIGRSQISSLGTTNSSSDIVMQSSVGQSSLINFENSNSIVLGQGFIQPSFTVIKKSELEVNLYPNPNNGTFNLVSISDNSAVLSYQLFSSYGNLIQSDEFKPNTVLNIETGSLTTGIYILKIKQNNSQITKKISIIN